jgi:hypothetical protein
MYHLSFRKNVGLMDSHERSAAMQSLGEREIQIAGMLTDTISIHAAKEYIMIPVIANLS